MSRFRTFLCLVFMCFILFRCSYRFPLHVLHFCVHVAHWCVQDFCSRLQQETGIHGCLLGLLTVELSATGCVRLYRYFRGGSGIEGVVAREVPKHAPTQTTNQWLKKMRRHDRHYQEVVRLIKEESRNARRRRIRLVKKYKLKTSYIKNDTESKAKLMTSVNKKVVSLALQIDSLMHRINEKRLILDRQRADNKHVLQRYEQLYQDLQQRYIYE